MWAVLPTRTEKYFAISPVPMNLPSRQTQSPGSRTGTRNQKGHVGPGVRRRAEVEVRAILFKIGEAHGTGAGKGGPGLERLGTVSSGGVQGVTCSGG